MEPARHPQGLPGRCHACPPRAQGPRQGQYPPPGPCAHRPGLPALGTGVLCTWAPVSSQGSMQSRSPAQETGQRMGRCKVSWGQSCWNLHPPSQRYPRHEGRAGPSSCFLNFSLRNRTCIPPKSLKHQRRFMKQSCALQRKKQAPPLQGAWPCPPLS